MKTCNRAKMPPEKWRQQVRKLNERLLKNEITYEQYLEKRKLIFKDIK